MGRSDGETVRGRLGLRPAITVAVGAAILAGILVAQTASASPAGAGPIRHRYRLADGLALTRIRYPGAPLEVRVLTVTQGSKVRADVLSAGARYPAYALPSVLAWEAKALAAVNGDFPVDGRPKHVSLMDGELWTTGTQRGVAFAVSPDGRRAFADEPDPLITAFPAGAPSFHVAEWNAGVPRRDAAAYSQRGGSVEKPPGDATPTASSPHFCAARLLPTGPISWAGTDRDRLARRYVVDAQPSTCPPTPLPMGSGRGTVALAGRPRRLGGEAVHALQPGQAVEVRWTLRGWPRVADLIGGTPQLVDDGVNVGPPFHAGAPYIFNRNPRTAVGVNRSCEDASRKTRCKIFIVTVDGRQSTWSHGLRYPALGRLFIRLGAYDAVNLDGGGSTELWVRRRRPVYCQRATDVGGCFVNRPSLPNERQTIVSLAVLAAPDRRDPRR
jgi:hypothetical protein